MPARVLTAALAVAALVPSAAVAQEGATDEVTDVTLRIGGPVRIADDDSANTVAVIDDTATVEGTVREQLFVVGGAARISGTVRGNVVALGSRVELLPGAFVGGDVVLYRSRIARAPDARVAGVVRERRGVPVAPLADVWIWLGMTTVALAAGLLFAAVAGRQLAEAAALIRTEPGPTVVAALLVVFGLPAAAVVSFFTLIGIPLGVLILLFLIPLLVLAGYLVTGEWIGTALLRRRRGETPPAAGRRYLPVVIGVLVLRLAALVPVLGAVVTLLAAPLGAGALAHRSWREFRARRPA